MNKTKEISNNNHKFTFALAEHFSPQKGKITYIRKNGNQHTMNVVTTTAIVRAAFLSLDKEILAFSLINRCISTSGVIVLLSSWQIGVFRRSGSGEVWKFQFKKISAWLSDVGNLMIFKSGARWICKKNLGKKWQKILLF